MLLVVLRGYIFLAFNYKSTVFMIHYFFETNLIKKRCPYEPVNYSPIIKELVLVEIWMLPWKNTFHYFIQCREIFDWPPQEGEGVIPTSVPLSLWHFTSSQSGHDLNMWKGQGQIVWLQGLLVCEVTKKYCDDFVSFQRFWNCDILYQDKSLTY